MGPVFEGAIRRLSGKAFNTANLDSHEVEERATTEAALRLVIEAMASDDFARARKSTRQDKLRDAIERKMLGSERRSREAGWSYLGDLSAQLGPWPKSKRQGGLRRKDEPLLGL